MTAIFKLVYENPDDAEKSVEEALENLRFLITETFLGELAPGESFEVLGFEVGPAYTTGDPGDEHEDIGEGVYLPCE